MSSAISVKDVSPKAFNIAFSEYLKYSGRIELPVWVDYAKTAAHREYSPSSEDWYYERAASIARTLYFKETAVDLQFFLHKYKSLARNGHRPNHLKKAAPAVFVDILKELVKIELVQKDEDGNFSLTETGRRDVDSIAEQVHDDAAAEEDA